MTAAPGLTPTSPLMVVGPVLVTVEPPSTPKLWAVPSVGAVAAAGRYAGLPYSPAAGSAAYTLATVMLVIRTAPSAMNHRVRHFLAPSVSEARLRTRLRPPRRLREYDEHARR